jgi:hypothetical protein
MVTSTTPEILHFWYAWYETTLSSYNTPYGSGGSQKLFRRPDNDNDDELHRK